MVTKTGRFSLPPRRKQHLTGINGQVCCGEVTFNQLSEGQVRIRTSNVDGKWTEVSEQRVLLAE